jgi:lysophospholipase L1-like esterase
MHFFVALPQPLRWYLGQRAQSLNVLLAQAMRHHQKAQFIAPHFPPNHNLLASDGFHPSSQAYSLWAKQLAQAINPFILTLAN